MGAETGGPRFNFGEDYASDQDKKPSNKKAKSESGPINSSDRDSLFAKLTADIQERKTPLFAINPEKPPQNQEDNGLDIFGKKKKSKDKKKLREDTPPKVKDTEQKVDQQKPDKPSYSEFLPPSSPYNPVEKNDAVQKSEGADLSSEHAIEATSDDVLEAQQPNPEEESNQTEPVETERGEPSKLEKNDEQDIPDIDDHDEDDNQDQSTQSIASHQASVNPAKVPIAPSVANNPNPQVANINPPNVPNTPVGGGGNAGANLPPAGNPNSPNPNQNQPTVIENHYRSASGALLAFGAAEVLSRGRDRKIRKEVRSNKKESDRNDAHLRREQLTRREEQSRMQARQLEQEEFKRRTEARLDQQDKIARDEFPTKVVDSSVPTETVIEKRDRYSTGDIKVQEKEAASLGEAVLPVNEVSEATDKPSKEKTELEKIRERLQKEAYDPRDIKTTKYTAETGRDRKTLWI